MKRPFAIAALAAAIPMIGACHGATTDATDDDGATPTPTAQILGVRSAASGGSTITISGVDGNDARTIATTSLASTTADAVRGGDVVVYVDGTSDASRRLYVVERGGTPRVLVGATAQIASAFAPNFAPGLTTVYFRATSAADPSRSAIWRVRTDGAGLERVGPWRTSGTGAPSISPDAATVMETTTDSVVFTGLNSGAVHGENVPCVGARYSPSGVNVSCIAGTSLVVYDAQFVGAPRTYAVEPLLPAAGTDWSADGASILVTSATRGPLLVSFPGGAVTPTGLGSSYRAAVFVR